VQRWHTNCASLLALTCLLGACAGQPNPGKRRDASAQLDTAKHEGILARVDAELARGWAAANIEPSPLADDAEFLRRVSLDLLGRVPTHDEAERFLADDASPREGSGSSRRRSTKTDADKRARLVDELLHSEAFAQHWASLWAERLIPDTRKARRYAGDELEAYLSEALADNRSWDRVVSELLTGTGKLDEQPQLAYLGARALRGDNKQDALAELSSTTARVFLGTRIECAQCHDHPYDPEFSREDFWAQAAFFGRTFVALDRGDDKKAVIEVGERGRGDLRVALDEAASSRKQAIAPRYMGAELAMSDSDPRRVVLANAIVDDPRFAEATVGWVWTTLLGRGIVEPWDDLLGTSERPALLDLLAAEFRSDGHDLRELVRTIVLSQAYQRSSTGSDATPREISEAELVFARASVRPLSAEQLFASVMTVTELDQVDERGFRRAVRGRQEAALREYEFVFADDEMAASDGFSASVPQALLLLNGELTNQGVVARSGGALDRILSATDDTDARLEDLWLTIYGRTPSADELALGRTAVARGTASDWEDLMFAMLYSSEFGSNH
jgi:hypothetical protein